MALPTRSQADCRTPRRNRDVANALNYFDKLGSWCLRVDRYLEGMMRFEQSARPSHDGFFPKRSLGSITTNVRHLLSNLCTHQYMYLFDVLHKTWRALGDGKLGLLLVIRRCFSC